MPLLVRFVKNKKKARAIMLCHGAQRNKAQYQRTFVKCGEQNNWTAMCTHSILPSFVLATLYIGRQSEHKRYIIASFSSHTCSNSEFLFCYQWCTTGFGQCCDIILSILRHNHEGTSKTSLGNFNPKNMRSGKTQHVVMMLFLDQDYKSAVENN
ncbi:hypothetical protein CAEBREN_21450 [Caenorhabditis brenneri]|uniref:Uncharacterized protein n=1 Tax=Caenorhabditis brenneri TaxID=135651 RepID=G0P409_CAEBE|nr:hypothetical protein CAEBREN_21450 [Caenorhabditis brenneri]